MLTASGYKATRDPLLYFGLEGVVREASVVDWSTFDQSVD